MKAHQPIVESVGFVWSCANIFFLWTCWGLLLLRWLRRGSYCWRGGRCVCFFYLNIARVVVVHSVAVGSMLMNYLSVYRIWGEFSLTSLHITFSRFSRRFGGGCRARALSVYEWLIYMRRIWIFFCIISHCSTWCQYVMYRRSLRFIYLRVYSVYMGLRCLVLLAGPYLLYSIYVFFVQHKWNIM